VNFTVDRQKVGFSVVADPTPQPFDVGDDIGDHPSVETAQGPIQLNNLIVSAASATNQPIRAG
jgi:hypothetical protein